MEPVENKRRRKLEYLHNSQYFRIPKSTFYDRRKRQAVQHEKVAPTNEASRSVASGAGTSTDDISTKSEASRSPPPPGQNATDSGTEDELLFDCAMDEVDEPWGDFWLDGASDDPL
ncbi:hypothetical protein HPB48_010119 [Haemaphysalis longicornis]|uniref:Uncharacterized protein n=1 Tax=Haemaphysalis longicornis TaxID=44386 RepID=A0A9J6GUZ9_HAELO|nr:hypothetical protein HPB48_010119 [Haemaphysalis longicornis]